MIKWAERSCKRPEISLSVSSYSNAVSHSLSNDSQHFGDGDNVAGFENKAENNFVKGDILTKSRGKTSKLKLDLTKTVIIARRYNVRERTVAHITSAMPRAALKAGIISSGKSSDITSALIVGSMTLMCLYVKEQTPIQVVNRYPSKIRGINSQA
ncbi:hypothetical protein AVEN_223758-1 [Araneus ventricosus]|uniref:Uncharacterized protein n=1 Tax=Araneus ventricosus TaxID=182803 RepID=A0A4Y2B0V7_ARAVE|nr:hypothetical protein AVEN_223758-1 [Araneus ventricosus]